MKKVSVAVFLTLAITSQAHALTEAQLNETCGPFSDAYKECSRTDDKCNEAALRRVGKIHACRMHALSIDAEIPTTLNPVPVETGAAP